MLLITRLLAFIHLRKKAFHALLNKCLIFISRKLLRHQRDVYETYFNTVIVNSQNIRHNEQKRCLSINFQNILFILKLTKILCFFRLLGNSGWCPEQPRPASVSPYRTNTFAGTPTFPCLLFFPTGALNTLTGRWYL